MSNNVERPDPEPQPEPEPEREWIFTFGCGQKHAGCYVRITGTFNGAREQMIWRYGLKWSMQYRSAADAGVDTWNLKDITP